MTASAFATDAVTVGDRLTINAGVRFDHSRAISQDLHARRSRRATKPTRSFAAWARMYTWNSVSPRLGAHREAQRRWPDDAAGELRTIQPGRADRRARALSPRRHPDHDDRVRPVHRRTTRASSRTVDPKVNLQLDPETRAPHTDEFSIGVDRELGRPAGGGDRLRPQERHRLHRLDRRRRSVHRGDANVGRRPQHVGVPPRHRLTPAAARRFLLTNPDGYSLKYNGLVLAVEKRRARRLAGVWLVYVVEDVWAAALQRHDRGGRAVQHGLPAQPVDVRPRSQRSHQRARPAAKRSAAHVPHDGQRRRATNGLRDRRQPAALQRQAVGGGRADHVAAGRPARSCSNRAARGGSRRRRCSMCACPGDRFGRHGRIELMLDVLNAAQRRGRGKPGERDSDDRDADEPDLRSAGQLRRSASRDGQRQARSRR